MLKHHSCLKLLFIQLTCQAHLKRVHEKKKTGLVYWKPTCNSDGTYSTTEKNVSFKEIFNYTTAYPLLFTIQHFKVIKNRTRIC